MNVGAGGGAGLCHDGGLAEELTDGIVVLGADGRIEWVNRAMADLVGVDVEDLIGVDGLGFVHPDDRDGSRANLRVALRHPERTTVIPYRLRRADGTDISVELRSSRLERPDGDRLALVIRDRSARAALTDVLQAVAAGRPIDEVFDAVVRMIHIRWPGSATLFAQRADGEEDVHDVLADSASAALVAHLARPGGPLPWAVPPDDPSSPGVVDVSALPVDVRAAAAAGGFTTCTAADIPDPGGAPARLVVWFTEHDVAEDDFLPGSRELIELLGLSVDRHRRIHQLTHLASHDSLTGLLNRDGFLRELRHLLGASRASNEDQVSILLYVDLDGLKGVNDLRGHAAGDAHLVEAAERLRHVVAPDDLLGRLGGDEFGVARTVDRRGSGAVGAELAQAIVRALADGAGEAGTRTTLTGSGASVGLVLDDGRGTAEAMIDAADAAMYRAKAAGRGRWSR